MIYKFTCPSCGACYIGETTRHLSIRTKEHLTDNKSNVRKHISACNSICDESCFSIIDRANTKFALQLKEGLHIR